MCDGFRKWAPARSCFIEATIVVFYLCNIFFGSDKIEAVPHAEMEVVPRDEMEVVPRDEMEAVPHDKMEAAP